MTMRIFVINDDPIWQAVVETIEEYRDTETEFVPKVDIIDPGKHKEFYIFKEKHIVVKEKE